MLGNVFYAGRIKFSSPLIKAGEEAPEGKGNRGCFYLKKDLYTRLTLLLYSFISYRQMGAETHPKLGGKLLPSGYFISCEKEGGKKK